MSRNKHSNNSKSIRTDQEKIDLFVKKSHELQETRIFTGDYSVITKKENDTVFPLETHLSQPDESSIKEYLLSFRHFIAKGEDTHLFNILSTCHKNLIEGEIKRDMAQLRNEYKKVQDNNSIQFIRNGTKYTIEDIANVFINGEYFHNDLEDQKLLSSLSAIEYNLFRSFFLNFIGQTGMLIVCITDNIKKSFEENLFQFENKR